MCGSKINLNQIKYDQYKNSHTENYIDIIWDEKVTTNDPIRHLDYPLEPLDNFTETKLGYERSCFNFPVIKDEVEKRQSRFIGNKKGEFNIEILIFIIKFLISEFSKLPNTSFKISQICTVNVIIFCKKA